MPEEYCSIYEIFIENQKYGSGIRLDEESVVLWIQNGTG